MAIGQAWDSIVVAADANKLFNLSIKRGKVLIGNGPFDGVSIALGCVKFILTPTLRLPRPNQGFSTYLVSPYPIKWLFLNIGMLLVFNKKLLRARVVGITFTNDWISLPFRNLISMAKFPRILHSRGIILYMLHIAPSFKD